MAGGVAGGGRPAGGGALDGGGAPAEPNAAATPAGRAANGIVLGSLLPDADLFLLGPYYLINSETAAGLHRTWSHSLLVQGLLALTLLSVWARSDPARRAWVLGFWSGLTLHSLADLILWFSGVDLLWPLGLFGLPSWANLWHAWPPPAWVSNLLGAGEMLFFALFFGFLARTAERTGTAADLRARLRTAERWLLAGFAVYIVLAVVLAGDPGLFNLLLYAPLILVLLPAELIVVVRMQETIARGVTAWADARGTAERPLNG